MNRAKILTVTFLLLGVIFLVISGVLLYSTVNTKILQEGVVLTYVVDSKDIKFFYEVDSKTLTLQRGESKLNLTPKVYPGVESFYNYYKDYWSLGTSADGKVVSMSVTCDKLNLEYNGKFFVNIYCNESD